MAKVNLSTLVQNTYTRTLLVVFGLLFTLLFSIIAYSYHRNIEYNKKCLYEKLQSVANTLVYQIKPQEVKAFLNKYKRKDDITTNNSDETYKKYHQIFVNIRNSTGLKGEIYTMQYIPEKNWFEFGFSSNEVPHYRHAYKDFPNLILDNYTTGSHLDVYKDKLGTWISAFVPVKDNKNDIICILQVDEHFDSFIYEARKQALTEALIMGLFSLLIAFLLFKVANKFLTAEEASKRELKKSNQTISSKNQQITSSIRYANKIQEAILPKAHVMANYFKGFFIMYEPKDIVSGDFYWLSKKYGDSFFIAAVDCTGHGVPGALMSMISSALIAEAVNEKNTQSTGEILNTIEKKLKIAFDQEDYDSISDGMDLSLCKVNLTNNSIEYSGAHRPLYLIRNQELIIIKGNRYSIGGEKKKDHLGYHSTEVSLLKGDRLYIFSDGYPDQFGGHDENQKFTMRKFKETLLNVQNTSIEKQGDKLKQVFFNWKKDTEQIDDVLVIGFEI